jgi:hypothetical protein
MAVPVILIVPVGASLESATMAVAELLILSEEPRASI